MEEYLTKITKVLDQAADDLDEHDYELLLEELSEQVTDRQGVADDLEDDEFDDDE